MSFTQTRLGRLALKTQAAWGTAESSFSTSTDVLEVEAPFIPPLKMEALRTDTYRLAFTEPPIYPGSKAAVDITIRGPLHGWSATTPTGNPTSFPDALMLARALGNIGSGAGYTTALAAGASTSTSKYTDGSASTAWEGFCQLFTKSGGYEAGWLTDIDTATSPDTGTLISAIAAAHSTSGTAFGSLVPYLSSDYDLAPLTFQWLGTASTDQIRFFDGGMKSFKLMLRAKKQPMFEATLSFLDWTNVASGGAPANFAYPFPQMPAWMGSGSPAYLNGSAKAFSEVTIEITQDLVESPGHSSAQGVSQWVASNRRVTVETLETSTNLSSLLGAPADDLNVLQVDFNSTPGRAGSFLLANGVLLEQPQLEDMGGIFGLRRKLGAQDFTDVASASSAPANTAVRFAFM